MLAIFRFAILYGAGSQTLTFAEQQAMFYNLTTFQDCTMPFAFGFPLDSDTYPLIQKISKVMAFIEDRTMIRFRYCSGYSFYSCQRFTTWSDNDHAGSYKNSNINLYLYGNSEYSVFRMILFALGVLEEVNRRDRDEYVEIDFDMISNDECLRYYQKYSDYPPVDSLDVNFTFDTLAFKFVTYCSKCKDCVVVKPRAQIAQNFASFIRRYGQEHPSDVTYEEYLRELPRLNVYYPYEKCYKADVKYPLFDVE